MYQRLQSDGISLLISSGEIRGRFSTISLAAADSETADPSTAGPTARRDRSAPLPRISLKKGAGQAEACTLQGRPLGCF